MKIKQELIWNYYVKQKNVQADIDLIHGQASGPKTDSLSIPRVLVSSRYRWPMLTTVVLQFAQALSGVNAVFFLFIKNV